MKERTVGVKSRYCALAILLAACAPSFGQTGPTGTWRVEGNTLPFPWDVVLRADGPQLTGAVSHCAPGVAEIFDGRMDGGSITFKCMRPDGVTRIIFTGSLKGDEFTFKWEMRSPDGRVLPQPLASVGNMMFGPSAPPQFTARRVPDGPLAHLFDGVRGLEFAAAVNLVKEDVKVEGTLFLPQKVSRVRSIIVVPVWGLSETIYNDPRWRKLAETTDSGLLLAKLTNIGASVVFSQRFAPGGQGDGLLLLLQHLAAESGHPELKDAPLLFFGFSQSGALSSTFVAAHPQRTIALVLYQSGFSGDLKVVSPMPLLLFQGRKDDPPNLGDATETLWKSGRSVGAPWTFVDQPEASHGNPDYFDKANRLIIPWITAVLRQGLPLDVTALRPITDRSAWMVNIKTGEVAPYATFAGPKAEANWLPDEASARAWQTMSGIGK